MALSRRRDAMDFSGGRYPARRHPGDLASACCCCVARPSTSRGGPTGDGAGLSASPATPGYWPKPRSAGARVSTLRRLNRLALPPAAGLSRPPSPRQASSLQALASMGALAPRLADPCWTVFLWQREPFGGALKLPFPAEDPLCRGAGVVVVAARRSECLETQCAELVDSPSGPRQHRKLFMRGPKGLRPRDRGYRSLGLHLTPLCAAQLRTALAPGGIQSHALLTWGSPCPVDPDQAALADRPLRPPRRARSSPLAGVLAALVWSLDNLLRALPGCRAGAVTAAPDRRRNHGS